MLVLRKKGLSTRTRMATHAKHIAILLDVMRLLSACSWTRCRCFNVMSARFIHYGVGERIPVPARVEWHSLSPEAH